GPKDVARIRLMEIQIQREAVKLNREREQLLSEVRVIMQGWTSRLQTRLELLMRSVLPPLLDGRSAREIGRILRSKVGQAWNEERLKVGFDIDKDTGRLSASDKTNVIPFAPAKVAKKTDPGEVATVL